MRPSPQAVGVQLSPTIRLNGTTLAENDYRLRELYTDRAVRTVGRCTMQFEDSKYELAESTKLSIGTVVEVLASSDGVAVADVSIFSGEVTGVTIRYDTDGLAMFIVTAEDLAHRMSRDSHVTTYAKSSYLEILRKIPAAHGMTASVSGGVNLPHEYVLQTDTDLALVNDLTTRTGLDWIVTDKTFSTWAPASGNPEVGHSTTLTMGVDVEEFVLSVTSAAPTKVEVRGFDQRTFQEVIGIEEGRPTKGGVPKLAAARTTLGSKVLDISGYPSSSTEAAELASARLTSQGNVTARGRVTLAPSLAPGGTFTLKEAGPASGDYYVREVTHTFDSSGAHTEFVAGDGPRARLGSVLGASTAHSTGAFLRQGTVIGVVTNITDPENLGRVKIKFPVLGDAIESDWARVTSVGGGPSRGLVATPEVNDEVLVAFENGDMRRPVIIGGLHNGKHAPSARSVTNADGKVETRSLSSRLGHVVELSDGTAKDKQYVLLSLAGQEHKLHLGKDRADLVVPANVPLTISSGTSKITFDGTGKITMKGTEITIDADTKISLKAPTIDIAATTKVSVKSSAQAEISGAMTSVKSSGITEISGTMVKIN